MAQGPQAAQEREEEEEVIGGEELLCDGDWQHGASNALDLGQATVNYIVNWGASATDNLQLSSHLDHVYRFGNHVRDKSELTASCKLYADQNVA